MKKRLDCFIGFMITLIIILVFCIIATCVKVPEHLEKIYFDEPTDYTLSYVGDESIDISTKSSQGEMMYNYTITVKNKEGNNKRNYKYDLLLVVDENTFNSSNDKLQISGAVESSKYGSKIINNGTVFDVANNSEYNKGKSIVLVSEKKIESGENQTYNISVSYKVNNKKLTKKFKAHFFIDHAMEL